MNTERNFISLTILNRILATMVSYPRQNTLQKASHYKIVAKSIVTRNEILISIPADDILKILTK